MSEVLQANIFFFITSIAVIVCTFLISILLFNLIKIAKSIRRIIARIEEGSEAIADDIDNLRVYITEESPLARFFGKGEDEDEEEDDQKKRSERSGSPRKEEKRKRTELRIKNEE